MIKQLLQVAIGGLQALLYFNRFVEAGNIVIEDITKEEERKELYDALNLLIQIKERL